MPPARGSSRIRPSEKRVPITPPPFAMPPAALCSTSFISAIMRIVDIVDAIGMGLGATLLIDLWGFFLNRAFDVRSLDLCLLGRWVLYIPHGTIVHQSIMVTPPRAHECQVGWTAHYLIGTTFAL